MYDPKILLSLVFLSMLLGYITGYAWRGSKLRKKIKARRAALKTAAQRLRNPYGNEAG